MTVGCQEEATPPLLLSPLLSASEANDLSPSVSVYGVYYCRFRRSDAVLVLRSAAEHLNEQSDKTNQLRV